MAIFTIDQDKCRQDGLCAADCPAQIIEFAKGSHPRPIPEAEELCLTCGHCAAVCPHGALSLTAMPLETMPPLDKSLNLSLPQAAQFLRSRRSCRQYKDEQIPQATLGGLIELAHHAPSGHNIQPTRWLVLSGRQQVLPLAAMVVDWMRVVVKENPALANLMHLNRVIASWEAGQDRILRGAPHVIIAHAPKNERTAPMGCVIALTYLELAAQAMGLGACWAGYFSAASTLFPPLALALALPEGHLPFGAMMVGYAKAKYFRLPKRNAPEIIWR